MYFFLKNQFIRKDQQFTFFCQDGDEINVCQVCSFVFNWNNERRSINYYSNLPFKNLAYAIFRKSNIPKEEYRSYGLKIKDQTISLDKLIPFEGLKDEIDVILLHGTHC